MADVASSLPQQRLPVLDGNQFTLPWWRFFQAVSRIANNSSDPAVIAQIEAEVATLQAEVIAIQVELDNLPSGSSDSTSLALLSLLDGAFPVWWANQLTTPRTFSFTGDVTGGPIAFDGSSNVSIPLSIAGGGTGSWIPLVTGAEPPVLVSDGSGHLVVVGYP